MSATALVMIIVSAAVWPFGRNRDDVAAEAPTIATLAAEAPAIDTEKPLASSTEKAIASYRSFLASGANDPVLRAEAMRRLADLTLESTEADALEAASATDAVSSIELYESLLATYPNYPQRDLALYQLARAYEATGQAERALAMLDRLVAEYPTTGLADEAQFRRGETLFVEQRYGEAEAAYADVIRYGSASAFYEQALYKHGWSVFKQFRNEDSLVSFFALLDRKLAADDADESIDPADTYGALGRADQELVADTLRVLAIAFSNLEGPASVTQYFATEGMPAYAYVVYKHLGDLYLDKERYQDAAAAYGAFVALDPYHSKAPLLQAEVIDAYAQGGFSELVLAGKQDFVARYAPGSPYWQRYSYAEQPAVATQLHGHLTDLAAYHHAKAQASREQVDYVAAVGAYRSLLEAFPEDAAAAGTNFMLAEALFESGRYGEAALEYERASYAYPFHAKSADAGYAALLAYARAEEEQATPGGEWHRRGIDSALRFAAAYPEHAETPAVLTDAAEKLYALGDLERAIDVAERVLTQEAGIDPALARTAWTVSAHARFDSGDFAAAERGYAELRHLTPADAPGRADIEARLAASIYKQGETARSQGELESAVGHFLRVGSAVPGSEIHATAHYDAAAALIQLGAWSRAATALEDFRAQFPKHALEGEVTANLAVAYLESGASERAASEFERLADGDGPEALRREALWRAAELHAESGALGSARSAWTRYVERYPEPFAEAIEARGKLVELATRQGDYPAKQEWLREIVRIDAAAGAARTERSRVLAARAQLELAAPLRDGFLAVSLVAPLERALAVKQERLQAALAAYRQAADYGVAEVTTAASFEIAELYHALGRDLLASERPPELSPVELEQYELLLEEQAFPFEEQAIEIHALNAARTAEGIYDEWVRKSLAALAQLVPVRYAKSEKGESYLVSIQ